MTGELQEGGTSPKTWANIIWGLMFLGPAALFLSLLVSASYSGQSGKWLFVGLLFPATICISIFAEIISIIIAYVKRGKLAGTLFESHATSAIRTIWISLVGFLIIVFLMITLGIIALSVEIEDPGFLGVLVEFPTLFFYALVIWKTFRIVRGLYHAMGGKPIANPTGWF